MLLKFTNYLGCVVGFREENSSPIKKKNLFSRPEYLIFTSNLLKNLSLKDTVCPNVEYEGSWLALWQSRSDGMGTSWAASHSHSE